MSLPDAFLEDLRTRLSLAQVVGRKVTWDAGKTNASKGEYWATCPFHQEKTASFSVNDQKGFFYCFGCHAKGDAIAFIRETENVGFLEAIEILAREAGMAMPKRDPEEQKKADRRAVLADIMEQAVQFYRLQINTNQAAAARNYLDGRRVSEEMQARFEIGFAPDARASLYQHLTAKGLTPKDLEEVGLSATFDSGGAPYDKFRNRIIFPIRNSHGRCIAFGGRAMDQNSHAKYLNSPATLLFDKGRSLYNHGPAREAAGKAQSLIVAEGYMDVIALAQAGFKHAVAPLGTAITESQLQLIWRMSPEPIIALDGDTAGIRAARRLMDLALPLISPSQSLRFVILPEGQDPDDLLKSSGAKVMQDLLDQAQPMVTLLWEREIEGKVFDSPERRAALDMGLRNALSTIKDRSLQNHYRAAIRELRSGLFAPKNRRGSDSQAWRNKKSGTWPNTSVGTGPQTTTRALKSSLIGQKSASDTHRIREALILAAAIRNPRAALESESELENSPICAADLISIQSTLLASLHLDLSESDASAQLNSEMAKSLGFDPMEHLMKCAPVRVHPHLKPDAKMHLVEMTLREELVKHAAIKGADAEIREAERDMEGLVDESLTWRIQQASQARANATRANANPGGEVAEDREKLSQYLQNLIDDEAWIKKKD